MSTLRKNQSSDPYIIGIVGGSGSGKTTFARNVIEPFGDTITLMSLDDYYHPRERQHIDSNGKENYDLPDAFDVDRYVADVGRLSQGETVSKEEYVYNNDSVDPTTLTYSPTPILVLEGLFLMHFSATRKLLDLSLFVHSADETRVTRRIKRDNESRNYPLDDVLYRWEHHATPAFDTYIAPHMHSVDLIVNNTHDSDTHVRVIRSFIKDVLET